MKKSILIISLFITFSLEGFCQDYVIKNNNDTILCKIIKMDKDKIYYSATDGEKYFNYFLDVKSYMYKGTLTNINSNNKENKPDILSKFTITGSGTTNDSLKMFYLRLKQLEDQTEFIKLNLKYSHKEFRTGTVITVLGIGLNVFGLWTLTSKNDSQKSGPGLIIGGGVLTFVGGLFMIDSHRFIGNAGNLPPLVEKH